jgi:ABC-type metal ion transport system substrate-binding protein
MKKAITVILLFMLFLAGCNSAYESDEHHPIVVQKVELESGKGVSKHHKTVKKKQDISFVNKIIKEDYHEETVERPSEELDYNFYFDNPYAKSILFHLWILPGNKAVIGHGGWYVALSQEDSEKLFNTFNIKIK